MHAALLLAAGKSSRMGRLKALLPWESSTLIAWQVSQLVQAGVEELVVVTGYAHGTLTPYLEELKTHYGRQITWTVVFNAHFETGKTSSIRLGAETLQHPGKITSLTVVGVDQPITTRTVTTLYDHLQEGDILIPAFKGRKGHPPVFSRQYLPAIRHVTEQGEGLRQIMKHNEKKVRIIEVPDSQVLLNLNTPSDYEKAMDVGPGEDMEQKPVIRKGD